VKCGIQFSLALKSLYIVNQRASWLSWERALSLSHELLNESRTSQWVTKVSWEANSLESASHEHFPWNENFPSLRASMSLNESRTQSLNESHWVTNIERQCVSMSHEHFPWSENFKSLRASMCLNESRTQSLNVSQWVTNTEPQCVSMSHEHLPWSKHFKLLRPPLRSQLQNAFIYRVRGSLSMRHELHIWSREFSSLRPPWICTAAMVQILK